MQNWCIIVNHSVKISRFHFLILGLSQKNAKVFRSCRQKIVRNELFFWQIFLKFLRQRMLLSGWIQAYECPLKMYYCRKNSMIKKMSGNRLRMLYLVSKLKTPQYLLKLAINMSVVSSAQERTFLWHLYQEQNIYHWYTLCHSLKK